MRGSIIDIPVIIFAVFFTAFFTIVFYTVFAAFNTEIQASSDIPLAAKQVMVKFDSIFKLMDLGLATIFVSLSLATLILARSVPSHPIYFIVGVISMVVVMIICKIVTDVYAYIASQAPLVAASNSFPAITFIMSNLSMWALGMFILLGLMMYTGGNNGVVSYDYE
jgi:hypothetical protein